MQYSIPCNALPALVTIHAVLFVTKQLNLFPVKGGIPGWSPKQIMTSEVVSYKNYLFLVGSYCQISEEGTPRNSMVARIEMPFHSDRVGMCRMVTSFMLWTPRVL